MIDRDNTHQTANQIIDVASWGSYDEYEVFPTGARDKSLRICPDNFEYDFCIPKHKYLFKEAIRSSTDFRIQRHPDQYWSEIIAFKIGRLMGVSIPPAFVAINSETGEPGSIIEWYTGYDTEKFERVSQGGDHMQDMIENYDRDKGKQHNLHSLIVFSKLLSTHLFLEHDWKVYWGLCLCFDALIGNTDRHQDNWEIIWGEKSSRFSPYFDNGTSLGHEIFPNKFNRMVQDETMLSAYINRGCHHMKWSLNDEKRLPLIGGVVRYCSKYPEVIPVLLDKLNWNIEHLSKILINLTVFNIKSPLTVERAEFIYKLTANRKQLLIKELEKIK